MKMLQTLEPFAIPELKTRVAQLLALRKLKDSETIELLNNLLDSFGMFNLTLAILFIDIDGKNFREIESHKVLSMVFKNPNVKVVATFSNMNFIYLLTQVVGLHYILS